MKKTIVLALILTGFLAFLAPNISKVQAITLEDSVENLQAQIQQLLLQLIQQLQQQLIQLQQQLNALIAEQPQLSVGECVSENQEISTTSNLPCCSHLVRVAMGPGLSNFSCAQPNMRGIITEIGNEFIKAKVIEFGRYYSPGQIVTIYVDSQAAPNTNTYFVDYTSNSPKIIRFSDLKVGEYFEAEVEVSAGMRNFAHGINVTSSNNLPDLTILNITANKTTLNTGETTKISATEANIGNVSAGHHYTGIFEDHVETPFFSTETNVIASGYNPIIETNYICRKAGPHTITAIADFTKTVVELNENNNSKTITINCITPTTKPITSNCGWCGNTCVRQTVGMYCPQVMPPTGYECKEVNGVCQMVRGTSPTCTDSDGNNIYTRGETVYKGETFPDYCLSNNTVAEYSCENDQMKSTSAGCPTGYTCQDGACKQSATNTCMASYAGGELAIGTNLTRTECQTKAQNTQAVLRYEVCSNIIMGASETIYIKWGNEVITQFQAQCNTFCTDTDGYNIYLKGSVNYNGQTYTDYCLSNNTVAEYSCENDQMKSTSAGCPTGYTCQDGACIISKKPDLIITNITSDQGDVYVGQSQTITATEKNIGETVAGPHKSVIFGDDSTSPVTNGTAEVNTLLNGYGFSFSGVYTCTTAGYHILTVKADWLNQVVESNENNNTSVITLNCLPVVTTTKPITSNCGWCGTSCVRITPGMYCPQVMPPTGYECKEVNGVCQMVRSGDVIMDSLKTQLDDLIQKLSAALIQLGR